VLRDESHLSENLHVGATLGIAEARMALQGADAGEKVLETFIWANPQSAYLELVFRRLDQIYAMQERPSEDDLHGWVKKPELRRAALARFYVARMLIRKKKTDKAAQALETFVRSYPDHPLLPYVHLTQADLLLEKGDDRAALAVLDAAARHVTTDELRADVELRTAFVHFRRGEYLLAANTFPGSRATLTAIARGRPLKRGAFDVEPEELRALCRRVHRAESALSGEPVARRFDA
jgi:predicted negative regulator of RcsB-dependent stress response